MTGPRALVLDNNDSFTYNLVQAIGLLGARPTVAIANTGDMPDPRDFDLVIISPGPGAPSAAVDSRRILELAAGVRPVLGVCLGHQVIAEEFGGRVSSAPLPRHGAVAKIKHDGKELFEGLPDPMEGVRYHSLAVVDEGPVLQVSARSEDGVIQGLRHPTLEVDGLQFHPESVLTRDGPELLRNFLDRA